MSLKVKHKRKAADLTPEVYVSAVMRRTARFQQDEAQYRRDIAAMNTAYTTKFCPRKVGDIIDLPEGAKPGYTHFTVVEITPRIKQSDDKAFNVYFEYLGTYTGPDQTPIKGTISTLRNDPPQDQIH